MSHIHATRRGKTAAVLLAGAALFGGTLTGLTATASATVAPKTPIDLSVVTTPGSATVGRTAELHPRLMVGSVPTSSGSRRATLLVTVTSATEAGIHPDAGLTCAAPVAITGGYTRACTTDAVLAPGDSLGVTLDLAPSTDPALRSMTVTGAATIDNTVPATFVDPVATNNKSKAVVKILDTSDFQGAISGASTVDPAATEGTTSTITNHGPDAAYARFRILVMNGSDGGFTADPGLTCGAAVPNIYNTGYTITCNTNGPLASGASASVVATTVPRAGSKTLTISATATKTGATVTDSNLLNNKQVLPVSIVSSGPPQG